MAGIPRQGGSPVQYREGRRFMDRFSRRPHPHSSGCSTSRLSFEYGWRRLNGRYAETETPPASAKGRPAFQKPISSPEPVLQFGRIRQTLKVTPAMAAAVTSRICEMGRRARMSLSNKTALAMIFKLAEAAERSWCRLNGHNQLPKIILGIKFSDGIEVVRSRAQTAAA